MIGLDLVVAQRPEQPDRDGDSRGRGVRMPFGSKATNQISPLLSRAVNPGEKPADFGRTTVQRPSRRSRGRVGSPRHLVGGYRLRVDPVGEPARIRHLVDRVDILRADVRRRIARPGEHVQEQIRNQIDVTSRDFCRVGRLRLTRQRIVPIEPRSGASDDERRGDGSDREGEDDTARRVRVGGSVRITGQKAAAPEKTKCQPSDPWAISMRSGV